MQRSRWSSGILCEPRERQLVAKKPRILGYGADSVAKPLLRWQAGLVPINNDPYLRACPFCLEKWSGYLKDANHMVACFQCGDCCVLACSLFCGRHHCDDCKPLDDSDGKCKWCAAAPEVPVPHFFDLPVPGSIAGLG